MEKNNFRKMKIKKNKHHLMERTFDEMILKRN